MTADQPVELCDIRVLKSHEHTDPVHVEKLFDKIRADAVWTHPVVIERDHGVILDGHHRFAIAKRLGLRRIPVVLLDYFDPAIQVCQRREMVVTKEDVIKRAKQQNPYPCKTTKHVCTQNGSLCPIIAMVPVVNIPLDQLR
ncbi:MAG TPA: ParB N-terminal domain-containing protein [bacterium]|nr:ParB N-terminal domain-containing protein [bacterium]